MNAAKIQDHKSSLPFVEVQGKICVIEACVLRAFGLLKLKIKIHKEKNGHIYVDKGLKLLAIVFIAICWFSAIMELSLLYAQFFDPGKSNYTFIPQSTSANPIVLGMMAAPSALITIRGALVPTLLFFKRSRWENLFIEAASVISQNINLPHHLAFLQKWRRWSICYILLTNGLVVCWTVFFQLVVTSTSGDDYYPLPIKLSPQQTLLKWAIFTTLPTLVSQIAYCTLVALAKILQDCTKEVNSGILKLSEENVHLLKMVHENSSSTSDSYDRLAEVLLANTEELSRRYKKLLNFCENLNEFFGTVLFAMYGLDVLCGLAYVANCVANFLPELIVQMFSAISVVTFFAPATVVLIPLVFVHEEGQKVNGNLHQLCLAMAPLNRLALGQGATLRGHLEQFLLASKDHMMVLRGAKIVFVTRDTLAETATVAISFAILIHEFFKN